MITPKQLQTIVDHYLIALLWSMPGDDNNENPGDTLSIHCDLGEGTRDEAERDCASFIAACGPLFAEAIGRDGYGITAMQDDSSLPATLAPYASFGHDFALTRNGHGAGFWDREALQAGDLGRELSSLCGWNRDMRTEFPDVDLYIGDDGKAYF